jgi:WD40 repeat protein
MGRKTAATAFALLAALGFAADWPARAQVGDSPQAARPAPARRGGAKALTASTASRWKLKRTLTGHEGAVYSASFFPDGGRVVTSGDDGRVRVWNVRTGRLLHEIEGPGGTVSDVSVSPDGRLIASCTDGEGARVQIWDAADYRLRRTLKGHEEGVFEVAFSPDGRLLASGGRDKVIRLWNVATGRMLRKLEGHDDAVTSLAFTPDGRRLASASGENDDTVRIWDVRTGRVLHTLAGHDDWVTSVAFAPDGLTLASGGRDRRLILWDALTGRKLREFRQPEMVYEIEFSPDGRVVAEAGGGGLVRLHDAQTGRLLSTIRAHREEINEVKFAPGGLSLLTASYDSTVKIWEPAPPSGEKKTPAKWLD